MTVASAQVLTPSVKLLSSSLSTLASSSTSSHSSIHSTNTTTYSISSSSYGYGSSLQSTHSSCSPTPPSRCNADNCLRAFERGQGQAFCSTFTKSVVTNTMDFPHTLHSVAAVQFRELVLLAPASMLTHVLRIRRLNHWGLAAMQTIVYEHLNEVKDKLFALPLQNLWLLIPLGFLHTLPSVLAVRLRGSRRPVRASVATRNLQILVRLHQFGVLAQRND